MARIAFIGLGQMGLPMATNLVMVGHHVVGHDLRALQMSRLQNAGGYVAESAAEAIKDANFVITCLPDLTALRSLWIQDPDVPKTVNKGTIIIDCSAIGVDEARTIASYLEASDLSALDAAPIGDPRDARARMLTFAVGGGLAAFAEAKSILEDMGERVIHVGKAGMGITTALCVQLMSVINLVGVAESFALAERMGLGVEKLFEVAALSPGASWALAERCPQSGLVPHAPSNNLYEEGLAAAQILKQLRQLDHSIQKVEARAHLTQGALALYSEFCLTKDPQLDFSAIIQLLRRR